MRAGLCQEPPLFADSMKHDQGRKHRAAAAVAGVAVCLCCESGCGCGVGGDDLVYASVSGRAGGAVSEVRRVARGQRALFVNHLAAQLRNRERLCVANRWDVDLRQVWGTVRRVDAELRAIRSRLFRNPRLCGVDRCDLHPAVVVRCASARGRRDCLARDGGEQAGDARNVRGVRLFEGGVAVIFHPVPGVRGWGWRG